jgi:glycosyltransferase involved in cell wall biosynthesis
MLNHVVLITDLSVEHDGATAIALAAARVLRRNGIKVTYVCGDDGNNPELKSLGIRVVPVRGHEIGATHPFQAAVKGLYNSEAVRVLRTVINEVDAEGVVYHLHNWSKILSPSIFQPLNVVSHRLIISTHDYFLACPNGGFFNFQTKSPCELTPMTMSCIGTNCDRRSYVDKIWRVARNVVRQRFLNLSNAAPIIVPVHDGMTVLLKRGGISEQSIKVLRNPVIPWSETRIEVEKNRTCLFVGRLDHDKGPDFLASAARNAGVPLKMIGDGGLRPFLERNYPEIELLGWQSRKQISEAARTARIVVMPSKTRETFGLVAFEALASGIPVIISKFAATADEIVRHEVGLSCDPYDHESLTQAIRSIATNDDQALAMSGRAWAARNLLLLSNKNWGEHLLKIYDDAASADPVAAHGF